MQHTSTINVNLTILQLKGSRPGSCCCARRSAVARSSIDMSWTCPARTAPTVSTFSDGTSCSAALSTWRAEDLSWLSMVTGVGSLGYTVDAGDGIGTGYCVCVLRFLAVSTVAVSVSMSSIAVSVWWCGVRGSQTTLTGDGAERCPLAGYICISPTQCPTLSHVLRLTRHRSAGHFGYYTPGPIRPHAHVHGTPLAPLSSRSYIVATPLCRARRSGPGR
jgi:hypothetical protein